MALTTALPKFWWLKPFQPLAINPTNDYTAVQLAITPSMPMENNSILSTPAELAGIGAIVTPPMAVEMFHSLFKFFSNNSQATSPNSKVKAAETAALEQQEIQSRSVPDPQFLFTNQACKPMGSVPSPGYNSTLMASQLSGHEKGGLSSHQASQVPVVINLEAEDPSTTGTEWMTDSSMLHLHFDNLPTQ